MKDHDVHSLSHTKWECKYHIVFAPKYRRKVFYGQKPVSYTHLSRTNSAATDGFLSYVSPELGSGLFFCGGRRKSRKWRRKMCIRDRLRTGSCRLFRDCSRTFFSRMSSMQMRRPCSCLLYTSRAGCGRAAQSPCAAHADGRRVPVPRPAA